DHRDVGNRALWRILHRDPPASVEQLLHAARLLLPTGIARLPSWKEVEHPGLDVMYQAARFAVGRAEVIPAPRDVARWRESQHPVGERIPLVVIEEKPSVQLLLLQLLLNRFDVHDPSARLTSASSSPSISTILVLLATPRTIRSDDGATPKRSARNRIS